MSGWDETSAENMGNDDARTLACDEVCNGDAFALAESELETRATEITFRPNGPLDCDWVWVDSHRGLPRVSLDGRYQ